MKSIAIAALVFALMALVLGAVALSGSSENQPVAELSSLRNELAAVRSELSKASTEKAELSKQLNELREQVAQLAARKTEPPPPAPEADPAQGKQKGKNELTPAHLPPPVKEAAAKTIPGVEIIRSEERNKKGQTYYKLKGRLEKNEYDLLIALDGGIIEADLPLSLVPAPIADACMRAVKGIEVLRAKRDVDNNRPIYRIEGAAGGEKCEARLTLEGEILRLDLPPSLAPREVAEAAAKAVEGIEITRVERVLDAGKVVFQVKGKAGGDKFDLNVAPNGEVLVVDMPVGRLPPAVSEAAMKAVEGLKLSTATRKMRDGAVIYELRGKTAQGKCAVIVSEDGKTVKVENPGGAQKPPAPPEGAPKEF